MNYMPQLAVLIAYQDSDAEFAESVVSTYGFEVTRYTNVEDLLGDLEKLQAEQSGNLSQAPAVTLVAGPMAQLIQNEVASTLTSASPQVPVVAVGSQASIAQAVELVRQGASDVVGLPSSREEMWEQLRNTLRLAEAKGAKLARVAELRSRMSELTRAENDVLRAILDGKSNKQIAQMLSIGLRTVELRRSKIMRKMKARSIAELIKFICQAGGCEDAALQPEQPQQASV